MGTEILEEVTNLKEYKSDAGSCRRVGNSRNKRLQTRNPKIVDHIKGNFAPLGVDGKLVQSKCLASEKIGNRGRGQTMDEEKIFDGVEASGTARLVKKSIQCLNQRPLTEFEYNDAMGPVRIITLAEKTHKQSGLECTP